MNTLNLFTKVWGEEKALEFFTKDMVKRDNVDCCVCFELHWGVKMPNCEHFICPKCFITMNTGYISSDFHDKHPKPEEPKEPKPKYPYEDKEKNRVLFQSITNDERYLKWFVCENEDLYNSVKIKSEFVETIDDDLKSWFENNELIEQYYYDLSKYERKYEHKMNKYYVEIRKYGILYEMEQNKNSQRKCPLCRSDFE